MLKRIICSLAKELAILTAHYTCPFLVPTEIPYVRSNPLDGKKKKYTVSITNNEKG